MALAADKIAMHCIVKAFYHEERSGDKPLSINTTVR